MNPEAVKWLEGLTQDERGRHFSMCNFYYGPDNILGLFSLKEDHEGCGETPNGVRCPRCDYGVVLEVG